VENVINRYRTSAFWRRDERNQCLGVRRVDTLGPQAYALNVNVRYWPIADIRTPRIDGADEINARIAGCKKPL